MNKLSFWQSFLNEFIEGLYKNDDVVLLKGIYRTFSQMAQLHSVFPLPVCIFFFLLFFLWFLLLK